jgi:Got1/Sft2-like family
MSSSGFFAPLLAANNEESSLFPQLSWKQRIYGWFICYLSGFLLGLLSVGSFKSLVKGTSMRFAVLYTLGNILSLMATSFLVGPEKQIKQMFEKKRWLCTTIYLSLIVLTLVLSFTPQVNKGFVILSVIFQWVVLLWYSLTFIPFGTTIASSLINRIS